VALEERLDDGQNLGPWQCTCCIVVLRFFDQWKAQIRVVVERVVRIRATVSDLEHHRVLSGMQRHTELRRCLVFRLEHRHNRERHGNLASAQHYGAALGDLWCIQLVVRPQEMPI